VATGEVAFAGTTAAASAAADPAATGAATHVCSLREEKWRLTVQYDALDFGRRFPLRWPSVHTMIAMTHRFLRAKLSWQYA
ncbi:hypothetical protein U2063_15515, partial [Listeria monocytogenes]|uniref:hypothetical protein n=1 Tax=Listeria monocytogenes TaxID=1639 RepID=UPI002FDBF19D